MDPSEVVYTYQQDLLVQQLLQDDCARYMEKIQELYAQRDSYIEKLGAAETAKQGLEKQNGELIGKIEKMDMAMQKIMVERDSYKTKIQVTKEDAEKIREQHAKELNDKDRMIQTLKSQLADSQEESAGKKVQELEAHLSATEQDSVVELKVFQEQHVKEIEGIDMELQTVQEKLAVNQEQRDEELNDKDRVDMMEQLRKLNITVEDLIKRINVLCEKNRVCLARLNRLEDSREESVRKEAELQECHVKLDERDLKIQELEARLSASEQQTVIKLTNEQKKKDEVAHIELGKLYLELQEAKKPQEALMAQLAAKDKEMECFTKQYEEKLAAKDSEIQNLKEVVQEGEKTIKNRDEMIAGLRNALFTMEYENMEMKKKTRKGAAPSDE